MRHRLDSLLALSMTNVTEIDDEFDILFLKGVEKLFLIYSSLITALISVI
jgi:hypothetical protein